MLHTVVIIYTLFLGSCSALYADIDVTVHVQDLESVKFFDLGWHQLETRVWVFTGDIEKTLAAVPVYVKDSVGDELPEGFKTHLRIKEDIKRCYSKQFYAPKQSDFSRFSTTLNEIHGFRVTLPASPSVLNGLGLFVEVNLYREKTIDNSEVFMDYIGSKVVRVANVLGGVHDYTEVPIETGNCQCHVSLDVHASLHALRASSDAYDPQSHKGGPEFEFWVKKLKKGGNADVYKWFSGAAAVELADFWKNKNEVAERTLDSFLKFVYTDGIKVAGTKIGDFDGSDVGTDHDDEAGAPVEVKTAPPTASEACNLCKQRLLESLYNTFAKLLAQNVLQTLNLSNTEKQGAVDYLKLLGDQTDLRGLQFVPSESLDNLTPDDILYKDVDGKLCSCNLSNKLNDRLNQLATVLGIAVPQQEGESALYIKLEGFPNVLLKVERQIFEGFELKSAYGLIHESFKPLTGRLEGYWTQYLDNSVNTGVQKQNRHFWDSFKQWVWEYHGTKHPFNWPKLHAEFLSLNLTDEHHFFLAHTCPFAKFDGERSPEKLELQNQDEHLLVLVHGEGKDYTPFHPLQNNLAAISGFTHVLKLPVSLEYEKSLKLDCLGERLFEYVDAYLQQNPRGAKVKYLSFIGHSYGGLVVRAALPKFAKYQHIFYAFVTIGTPHLGYPHVHSRKCKAVEDCNCKAKKFNCEAKKEVELTDDSDKTKTFLYKMSLDDSLQHFRVVRFFGMKPDLYCPACSAVLKTECIKDDKNVAHQMADNLKKCLGKNRFSTVMFNYRRASAYIATPICKESHSAVLHRKLQTRILVALLSDIF